ncbi:MAG: hypothetical protein ABGW69_00855 [Nanoarchaeota archaeon]
MKKMEELRNIWPEKLIDKLTSKGIKYIVPLKHLDLEGDNYKVLKLNPDDVFSILRQAQTKSGKSPYKYSYFEIREFNPQRNKEFLYSYQTFVQRGKLNKATKIRKLFPWPCSIIKNNEASFYIPPIIEVYSPAQLTTYGNELEYKEKYLIIRDGNHRIYSSLADSESINVVFVYQPRVYLPSIPQKIEEIKIVEEKPELYKRYKGLKEENWLKLKELGFDA